MRTKERKKKRGREKLIGQLRIQVTGLLFAKGNEGEEEGEKEVLLWMMWIM